MDPALKTPGAFGTPTIRLLDNDIIAISVAGWLNFDVFLEYGHELRSFTFGLIANTNKVLQTKYQLVYY